MATMMKAGAFKAGDILTLNSVRYRGRGSVIRFRDVAMRRGTFDIGADLLCEDGTLRFYYLHDLTLWNPDKLAETFGGQG
jgi:hypothetical protein